jgi:signal transduction histidine kinase
LFAIRVLELERIAWREGRRRARRFERYAIASFMRICLRTLRPGDVVAHDPDTDVLLAALMPRASDSETDLHHTARAVLSELMRCFDAATGLDREFGWTVVEPADVLEPGLRSATAAALQRGRRERERFEFFATLGHEMRTPLMSISGYVQTLIERDLDLATTRRFLETAQLEAMRLRRLVDSMYELSLMDLNESLASGARCDIQSAVERACDAIYPLAALRGTQVKVCSRVKRAVPLPGERAVILFSNLLENAVKHGRPGGRIEIRLTAAVDRLEVWIDDDGPGVPEADRRRIFERGARGATTASVGSGLGLAIVDNILRRIGGDVSVARSPLGGARFRVRIPFNRALSVESDAAAGASAKHTTVT